MSGDILIWIIAVIATAGVVVRPWRWPEAVWAVAGAVLLGALGLLPWTEFVRAVLRGLDVYLFLAGMMLLSEVARREGLFDWLAAFAVRRANGSASRLFLLIYAVGIVVTALMSNDATAVVLTPAVFAAAKAARAEPLPYLFICALIANAASFVLPISNPANLVLYQSHLPPLPVWIGRFILPSILSIATTFIALRLLERKSLRRGIATDCTQPALSRGGKTAAIGIGFTASVLLAASTLDIQLGLPTAVCGAATVAVVLLLKREAPWGVVRGVSWAVLPLVGGLFVLVAGLGRTAVLAQLAALLQRGAQASAQTTAWIAGIALALVCNVMNNLPAGLIAGSAVAAAQVPRQVTDALLIGVDLGPNLSITGSLATILWLTALRRDGVDVSFGRFLRIGAVVMPVALLCALAALRL